MLCFRRPYLLIVCKYLVNDWAQCYYYTTFDKSYPITHICIDCLLYFNRGDKIELVNLKVYKYLLSTYGKRPSIWFGLVAETSRAIVGRVVTVILLAGMAASVSEGDFERARNYVLLWAGLTLFFGLLASVGELFAHKGENKQYGIIGLDYYKKLSNKDMSFYRNNKTGYLTAVFRQHLDSGMLLVRMFRGEVVRTGISLTIPIIVLMIADFKVGFVAFLLMILQVIYITWSSAKANKYRIDSHEIYRELSGEVADDITNIVAYRSSGNEKGAVKRINKLIDKELISFWKRRSTVILLNIPRSLLTTTLVAIAFWVALSGDGASAEIVGLLVLTITYMFQIVRNVDDLPDIISQHDDLVTKLYPTLEVLSEQDKTINDSVTAKELVIKKAQIEIRNLRFKYIDSDNSRHVFKDLNIKIKGGEKIGVVGLSGAGKSTLASLLMRFDEAQSGQILIDGTDIKEVMQSDLRTKIAYVPQEPLLFHRTIKENIAYHNPEASDTAVMKAAKAAHAHEFISDLPKGYDTVVGERGVKLSGGQKQRVVIARAVLKQAPIILFDEATSALDSESEHIIQQALPEIIGKHTAIIIAHRLSTVSGLDRIIVMHDGEIVEEGTHKQLLARKGRYHSLWKRQTTESLN